MITCGACLEQFLQEPGHIVQVTTKDSVCCGCFDEGILRQFLATIDKEAAYPVNFSPAGINIKDFANYFSAKQIKLYHRREIEYRTA